ncbi:MAG: hypothetical protein RLZZ200_806 [Pseudomonadota bacterium]|jgi:hypothetical protein
MNDQVIESARGSSIPVEARERRFFLYMAIVLALTILGGFGGWFLKGNSSFSAPWWVHVHAVSNMAWIALFVAQTHFISGGDAATHRRFGRWGFLLAIWMLFLGVVLTPYDIAVHRFPTAFFTPALFLAMDWMNILMFALLVLGGWMMRRRSDWHRRLMMSATIIIIMPAWGRLLIMAGLPGTLSAQCLLVYFIVAMIADWRIRGRTHPAWYVGVAGLVLMVVGLVLLSEFPPLVRYADALNGG